MRNLLNNYRSNLLREIEKRCTKYLRSTLLDHVRRSSRARVLHSGEGASSYKRAIDQLDGLMPWLNKLPADNQNRWSSIPDSAYLGLITRCLMAKWYRGDVMKCAKVIAAGMRADAEQIEMLCMAPPARQAREARPTTLAGRRARNVNDKVKQWERRLAIAKTKLKLYRKKQAYYQKKGVAGE